MKLFTEMPLTEINFILNLGEVIIANVSSRHSQYLLRNEKNWGYLDVHSVEDKYWSYSLEEINQFLITVNNSIHLGRNGWEAL